MATQSGGIIAKRRDIEHSLIGWRSWWWQIDSVDMDNHFLWPSIWRQIQRRIDKGRLGGLIEA